MQHLEGEIERFRIENGKLAAINQELRIALADAIRCPMGVVPDSAAGLVSPADVDAAEARRVYSRFVQPAASGKHAGSGRSKRGSI